MPDPSRDVVPGGAVDPTPAPVEVARGSGRCAALTFDDGPDPGDTERLLGVLGAHGVTATFFVVGRQVRTPAGAAVLRRIVAEGHVLGNHSTDYADLGGCTEAEVEADLVAALRDIRTALDDPAAPVPYFRAPNGSWGVTAGVAARLGMQPVGLGEVIHDWDGHDLRPSTLAANLRAAIRPGAVVLVHDGGGDRSGSVAAVAAVLPEKLAEGWRFTLPAGGPA